MKKLILAASIALFAAPAFAAETTTQQTAMDTNAQAKHTYSYSTDEGARGAIATRNARQQRLDMERSQNAKATWAGSAHYY